MSERGAANEERRPATGTPLALIVDDDDDMREFLTLTVKADGFLTHAVSSGAEALEYLAAESADLLITDQRMPGLTGLDVAKKLRADGFSSPIVLFSAYMDPQLARACKRLNVQPLSKVDIPALRRVVQTFATELRG